MQVHPDGRPQRDKFLRTSPPRIMLFKRIKLVNGKENSVQTNVRKNGRGRKGASGSYPNWVHGPSPWAKDQNWKTSSDKNPPQPKKKKEPKPPPTQNKKKKHKPPPTETPKKKNKVHGPPTPKKKQPPRVLLSLRLLRSWFRVSLFQSHTGEGGLETNHYKAAKRKQRIG